MGKGHSRHATDPEPAPHESIPPPPVLNTSFGNRSFVAGHHPELLGFASPMLAFESIPGSNPELVRALARALPTSCRRHWKVIFSSAVHGKSFARLVECTTNQGPTIVFIRESLRESVRGEDPDGDGEVLPPPDIRVFGGFCSTPWLTVQDRERAAKSNAAAKARSERTGYGSPYVERPKNQAVQFFGDEPCFVFTSNTASGAGPAVYQARSHVDRNFMYLFDRHPDPERVGLGMGGQAGFHAWFLDRWLEAGHCRGTVCPTFGNPALCPREDFLVDSVEVYAVDENTFDVQEARSPPSPSDASPKKSHTLSVENPNTNVDKMLLELDGVHHFRSEAANVS